MKEKELAIAKEYGLEVLPDPGRGEGWSMYKKDDYYFWYCSRGWACAKLEDNHYRYHTYHSSLELAAKAYTIASELSSKS